MNEEIIISSRSFFSGTMLSRITGMLRDMALAFFFGSTPAIAAFMVAYRLANLFRRLLGEGTLQSSFTPYFAAKKAESNKEAAYFLRDLFYSLSFLLFLVVGILELLLYFVPIPGEIALLSRIMLPGIIFICLYALNSSHLQFERRFFLPAVAPVAFNIVWIVAAFCVEGTKGLAVAVVIAFFFQWLMTAMPSFQLIAQELKGREWFTAQVTKHKGLLKPLSLSVIGVAATQVNTALDALFARFADPSGPAYLWYAIRLEQMPMSLFGIAIAGALLPSLSRYAQAGDWGQYRTLLQFTLASTVALMFAATAALFVGGGAGINLIYGRGNFDSHSVANTLLCLWGYATGLLPATLVLLLASAFYARKEFLIPTLSSLFAVVVNITLNAFFVFALHWGSFSIAVATSISAFCNCFFLWFFLQKKVPFLFSSLRLIKIVAIVFVSSSVALWVGYVICHDPTLPICLGKHASFPRNTLEQLWSFSLPAFTFTALLFLLSYFFRLQELLVFLQKKKVQ